MELGILISSTDCASQFTGISIQLHRIYLQRRCSSCHQKAEWYKASRQCRGTFFPRSRLFVRAAVGFCGLTTFNNRMMRMAHQRLTVGLVPVHHPAIASSTSRTPLPPLAHPLLKLLLTKSTCMMAAAAPAT